MKVTVIFEELGQEEAKDLLTLASKLSEAKNGPEEEAVEEKQVKTKQKTKKAAPIEVEEEIVNDDEPEAEEESEVEAEDEVEADEDGPTLADVMAAFKAFVKKHKGDKKAAIPILKKFKVKSPSELEEKDFAKVLKLLK